MSMSAQDGKGAQRQTVSVVELRSFAPENLTESYLRWLRDLQLMRFSNQRFGTYKMDSCRAFHFAKFAPP